MRGKPERIKDLTNTFKSFLEQQEKAVQTTISAALEMIKSIQSGTSDRRLQRLASELKDLQQRAAVLFEMSQHDFLAKIEREAGECAAGIADNRIAAVLHPLIQAKSLPLRPFCEKLLDGLVAAIGAGRGFLVLYLPESSEAEVVAARNFQTDNLSLEEYTFSRTLLREGLQRGESLLVKDASGDPAYSKEMSVVAYELKSVLVVPIKQNERPVGAIYLDNRHTPSAFDEDDRLIVDYVAAFASFYLSHTRLLPGPLERSSRVFLDDSKAPTEILGNDPKIRDLLGSIRRIADSDAAVLIEGESGTGKELVARALHSQSARRDRPFVALNCAAIPENLFESELFGHERGAFSGAEERFAGHIQEAHRGTLFLDEVSELPYPTQAKLLRFLQSQEFHRLGAREPVKVDVRVVAATSKDLKKLMEAGKFQESLYYRLNVISLVVPALRERKADIPLLVEHFVSKFSAIPKRVLDIDPEVYDLLTEYDFPGNVRELENLIHRTIVLAESDTIRSRDLPREIVRVTQQRVNLVEDRLRRIFPNPPRNLEELHRQERAIRGAFAVQRRALAEQAVKDANGNKTLAASQLGVNRITLIKMLRKPRSSSPDFGD